MFSNKRPQPRELAIHCPFAEKDEAKALGAKWDSVFTTWFAPTQAVYDKLSKWHEPVHKRPEVKLAREQARQKLARAAELEKRREPEKPRQLELWERQRERQKALMEAYRKQQDELHNGEWESWEVTGEDWREHRDRQKWGTWKDGVWRTMEVWESQKYWKNGGRDWAGGPRFERFEDGLKLL